MGLGSAGWQRAQPMEQSERLGQVCSQGVFAPKGRGKLWLMETLFTGRPRS